jgi:hypothetical protein
MKTKTLSAELLHKMDSYWRAANYLSVGQIYLYDNPLLKRPLKLSDVKPLVVGHWGTTPGQNFIYVHLNRVIKKYDLDMFYIAGPGHGGPAIVGNVYLEGTWSEVYLNVTQDEAGLKKLFEQFSFPGGISSHVAPTTLGSIHEGGELGYSLSHTFGATFDNPDLIVACVVGDGEAETGPLATSWQSNSQRLLPLDATWQQGLAKVPWPTKTLPEVTGGGTATLRALLREYLFISLFRACAESLASENASRLAAMGPADKNIDESLETLHGTCYRLRQAGIDEELFDVIAGFEALKVEEE